MSSPQSSSIAGVVIFTIVVIGTIVIIVALTKLSKANAEENSWFIAAMVFASIILTGAVIGLIVSAVGTAKLKEAGNQIASSVGNWWNSPANTGGGIPYSAYAST
jgi:uncharacterized membrane protein